MTQGSTPKRYTLDHVLKYIGVFGGVQGLTMLVSVIRNYLASSLLGTIGFALVSIYNSIGEFVSSSSNFGIPFSAVRHVSELYEEEREDETRHFVRVVRTWCVWTACLAVVVLICFSPLLARAFSDKDITLQPLTIILLAPMVASMAITGGEISILKGTHRLKRVASISALGAVSTFVCTIPFYWLWHINGIIVALDVSTIMYAVLNLAFTHSIYPWHISPFSTRVFREGWSMIRLGVPYVLAAIAGSGVALALPALFVRYGNLSDVGLYRAAFVVMGSYAGIVFTALEADYFPRLSSVNHDVVRRNHAIDQQVRACVLVIAPLLILMMLGMPLIIRILFAPEFAPVVPMAVCASIYTFSRAITLPLGYTALACGHSVLYLFMEIVYDLISLFIIVGCYQLWGPTGAGIGLSYGFYYHIRLHGQTLRLAVAQAFILLVMIPVCLLMPLPWKLAAGLLCLAVSAWLSYKVLSRESDIVLRIKNRLRPPHA